MKPKAPWSVLNEAAEKGDLRTLALATPEVTPERVEQLVLFQKAFVRHLAQVPAHARQGSAWETWQARAHEQALTETTLSHHDLTRLLSFCQDFCRKRRTELEIEFRRAKLADQGGSPDVLAELDKALARKRDSTFLASRYGVRALELLQERESELLELHEQLWRTT